MYAYRRSNERSEKRMGRKGVKILEEGEDWGLPGLLYTDDSFCAASRKNT